MEERAMDEGVDRRSFLRLTGTAGVVGASTMLAGCGEQSGGETTEATPNEGDTDQGGEESEETESGSAQHGGTVTVAMQSDFDNIHPHKSPGTTGIMLVENMSNSLYRVSPTGELLPDLASDMPEVSDDGLQYVVPLKEGVQFHPPYDREMTAEDVVENFRRILDSDYGAYGRGAYVGTLTGEGIDPEETVQVTDDYEVTFNLEQTYAPFLMKQASLSSYGWFSIAPPEAIDEHGENLGNAETGSWATGPFMYNAEESTAGSEYVLDRNPNYFREDDEGNQLPYVDRAVITIAPEASVRTTQLQSGEIDINESVAATDVDSLTGAEGVEIKETPSTAKTSQWANIVSYEPTSNKTVRKAMMNAMNREAIVQTKFQGHAEIAHSVFPPWHWAYNKDACVTYDHDPQQAEQLLEEAGYPDGFSLKCEPSNQPKFVDVATLLQQQYAQVGIDMSVQPAAKNAAYDPIEDSPPPEDWHSLVENFTWAFSADDYTGANFHSDAAFNYTHYSNEEADELMMEARHTVDRDRRKELYNDIQGILTDDLPKLFILWNNAIHGHRSRVNGFRVWPTASIWLEDVWLEQ